MFINKNLKRLFMKTTLGPNFEIFTHYNPKEIQSRLNFEKKALLGGFIKAGLSRHGCRPKKGYQGHD